MSVRTVLKRIQQPLLWGLLGLIPVQLLVFGWAASRDETNGPEGCTRLGVTWINEGSSATFIDGDERRIVVTINDVVSARKNQGSISIDGKVSPFGDGFLTDQILVDELVTHTGSSNRVAVAVDHCTNGGD
jgi:hypothetical protein